MSYETNGYQNVKGSSRNRIFNQIREAGSVSASQLSYELQLSRPTVKKSLDELLESGYIYESGFIGNTGGRRAGAYSVMADAKAAIGIDLTRNHITVIIADLNGNLVYEKRVHRGFVLEDAYMKYLGELVEEAIVAKQIPKDAVLGVGIVVPGLITEDHREIFYGKILDFTGLTVDKIGKYIPQTCRLYNDADAGGYAEISQREDMTDAFYISLSNNIGGSILIDHKVYKGEGPRSGEVGHMTIIPGGRECYCGQKGCFETYCNASLLADMFQGNLEQFFERLAENDADCVRVWQDYLYYLSIAVNNVRMLFDCKVILGGYVGAHMEPYLDELKELAAARNTFESNADYLEVCRVKRDALALGGALPFIHELWRTI